MGCAIRIFNAVPRVRMAQNISVNWASARFVPYRVDAIICLHGTVNPIPDLEWPTAVQLGIGAAQIYLSAANSAAMNRVYCA